MSEVLWRGSRTREADNMMLFFTNVLLIWSLGVAHLSTISQPVSLQALKVGEPATIKCHITSNMMKRVWYKLTKERRLQLVATLDCLYNRSVFAVASQRYSAEFDLTNNHLIISPTSWDDVGTYFCGVVRLNDIQFGSGTFLMLNGAKMSSGYVDQQPESQSVWSGATVTLRCSVHSGQCAAEHTDVMWLKKSEHSAPQMIHSSGNKKASCQWTESGETTCVYNLLVTNLSTEDVGIYYCVATSCGQTLFGNGTKLIFGNIDMDIPDDMADMDIPDVPIKSNPMMAVPFIIAILGVSLPFFVCMITTGISCYRRESHARLPIPSITSAEVLHEEYFKIKRSKRQRDGTWSECVYSVKKSD